MNLTEQVVAQAQFMARELAEEDRQLLQVACQAAVSTLEGRLREDLTPEDCQADFVTAAGMLALAMMAETGALDPIEQMTAGDLTLRRSGGCEAARQLRGQAELLMAPYLKTRLAFLGV